MDKNFHDHVTSDIWPSTFPDLTPIDYCLWVVLEKYINKQFYSIIDSLKATIVRVMPNMNQHHLIKACRRFRSHVLGCIKSSVRI